MNCMSKTHSPWICCCLIQEIVFGTLKHYFRAEGGRFQLIVFLMRLVSKDLSVKRNKYVSFSNMWQIYCTHNMWHILWGTFPGIIWLRLPAQRDKWKWIQSYGVITLFHWSNTDGCGLFKDGNAPIHKAGCLKLRCRWLIMLLFYHL